MSRKLQQAGIGDICSRSQYNRVNPIPTGLDWTQADPPVVTAVENQGDCADCWAFSAAGAITGISAIETKTAAVALSVQVGKY